MEREVFGQIMVLISLVLFFGGGYALLRHVYKNAAKKIERMKREYPWLS